MFILVIKQDPVEFIGFMYFFVIDMSQIDPAVLNYAASKLQAGYR